MLIYATVGFFAGFPLMMERRLLGQNVLFFPLVIAVLLGWFLGDMQTALWLGVCFQLFFSIEDRFVDWVAAAYAGSMGLLMASFFDVSFLPGNLNSMFLLFVSIALGALIQKMEIVFEHRENHVVEAKENYSQLMRQRVFQGLGRVFIELFLVVLVVLLLLWGLSFLAFSTTPWMSFVSVFVPVAGLVLVLGAHVSSRYVLLLLVGFVVVVLLKGSL